MARRRNKGEERDIASRRIDRLLDAATNARQTGDAGLAARYGSLALRIATRYQTGLSPAQRARACRKCGSIRALGGSRTRIRGAIVTTCLGCGAVRRQPLRGA